MLSGSEFFLYFNWSPPIYTNLQALVSPPPLLKKNENIIDVVYMIFFPHAVFFEHGFEAQISSSSVPKPQPVEICDFRRASNISE